jgi:putative FmdB family regulatory protein
MPIYEYECRRCGRTFDKLVRGMAGAETPACEFCGSPEVSRKVSAFAFSGEGMKSSSSGSSCGSCSGGSCSSCGH